MGKGKKVSMDVLEKICKYFNCNIGDIVCFEGISTNDEVK